MKKIYTTLTFLSLFLINAFAQSAGDLQFVVFNADDNDDLAFVLLADFPANDTIFFTDEEWNGMAFNSPDLEGDNFWYNTQITPAGTVIMLSDLGDTLLTSANIGMTGAVVDPGGSSSTNVGKQDPMGLSGSGESVYAYIGTLRNPTVFLGAFTSNSWTAGDGDLAGTGLTSGVDVFPGNGSNGDVSAYNGLRSGLGSFDAYKIVLNNISNWDSEGGSGSQTANGTAPDKPFDATVFTISGGNTGSQFDIVITEIMYNTPGTDVEFLELYNNDNVAVDLNGFSFLAGVTHTFGAVTLNPGDYYVITNDATAYTGLYGGTATEWTSGGLSNGGETILLVDANTATVDSVAYDDASPWYAFTDGAGSSLILCDVNADNADPANWNVSTSYIATTDCENVYATPGAANTCGTTPFVVLEEVCDNPFEDAGTIEYDLFAVNPNGMATSVDVTFDAANSTATLGTDFTFTSPLTLTFPAGTDTAQTISITIIDDGDTESSETIVLTLTNATNGATIGTMSTTITITDNDAALTNSLTLVGLIHGPISGTPKAVELYVSQDIPDLSLYGLGSANNGGGTDGIEYNFPAVSASAGDVIFVANDTAAFSAFFGINAQFQENSAITFNGDDAFEVFEGNQVIDVFGDINVDGTGTTWEYDLGWAHRNNGTGPDGSTFVESNWTIANGAFFNVTTNSQATNPYPLGTFIRTTPVDLSNDIRFYPNPVQANLIVETQITIDQIVITNILGQTVLTVSQPNTIEQIPVQNLSNGLYIVSFVTEKGAWSQQLVVQK